MMKKLILILLLTVMSSLKVSAQTPEPGFSQDVVIKDSIRKYIKDNEERINKANPRTKTVLNYPVEPGKEFKLSVWDKGSSFTQQSFSLNDIDMSSYELLSANLSFSDKDQVQKIVFLPFKISQNENVRRWLSNFKVNMALKGGISTFGVGIGGDNSDAFSSRGREILEKLNKGEKTPRLPTRTETFEEYEKKCSCTL